MNRELPPRPALVRVRRASSSVVVGLVALALSAGMSAAPASADQLDSRRAEIIKALAANSEQITDASVALVKVAKAYDQAQQDLTAAESTLDAANEALREAKALDAKRADELAAAESALKMAEAAVVAAQAAFDAVDRRTNQEITEITQQSSGLMDLAMLVGSLTANDLNQQAQLGHTLLDSSALELDELTARRFALEDAQTAAQAARTNAQSARDAAATQLADSTTKQAAADSARDSVASLVASRDAAQKTAADELALAERVQAALESESTQVDARIKARNEAAAKAAREKAAREKAAREAAAKAAAAKAAAAKAAAAKATAANKSSTSRGSTATRSSTTTVVSSTSFLLPVQGRFSSPYGMRLHPVLGYWKLHDGQDIAAACGTPMRAPYAGVVAEKYYNAGYGNRLMIDHGLVQGSYVTTGLNHAIRYTVSVGEKVTKGQIVGYVGNTGYSTGCHLHLMVWEDGSVVNPMTKWFD